jgi:hypothetical protein
MEIHLKIIGILLIALALAHIVFPKYFKWKEELKSLNLINKEMMLVHTFFVALTVLLIGLLCLVSTSDLIATSLGKNVCFGFGLFWSIRLVIQFFGYSKELWKGKTFETTVHIIFSLLWTYLSVVFFVIWWG